MNERVCPLLVQRLAWLALGLWAGLSIFLPWRWSILMDETTFLTALTAGDFFSVVKSQFWGYWETGRFYPVKMLLNVLEWRLLPLDPVFFHQFHFGVIVAALLFAWGAMQRRGGAADYRIDGSFLGFFLASAILAKPVMDGAQFLSIGEGWAAFFLAVGLFLFVRGNGWLARVFWVLAAWSKEPMAGVFASSLLYQVACWGELGKGKRAYFATDLSLFCALSFGAWYAMQQGPYLADYTLLSFNGLASWFYSVARLAFFLFPLLGLAAYQLLFAERGWRAVWASPRERAWFLFLLSFVGGYLFLVSPKGASGYLQIPAALAALLLVFPYAAGALPGLKARGVLLVILACWAGMGLYSLRRWSAYAHGINEVSLVFPEMIRSQTPRLLIVNGAEMADILARMAKSEGWENVRLVEVGSFDPSAFSGFTGEVVLMEPTRYFDPLPAGLVQKLESWAGGWKYVSASSPSYRLYFGWRNNR